MPAPDPSNPDLLEGIRAYLITQAIVRDPRDATLQATLPPCFIEHRWGTPAPNEGEGLNPVEVGPTLVVNLKRATGVSTGPYEGFIRYDHTNFVVRALRPMYAISFESQVRSLLHDRRNWLMDNVQVNESLLVRDLQEVTQDNTGWTYTMEYQFTLWGSFTPVGP